VKGRAFFSLCIVMIPIVFVVALLQAAFETERCHMRTLYAMLYGIG